MNTLNLQEIREELMDNLFKSFVKKYPDMEDIEEYTDIPFGDKSIFEWENDNDFDIQHVDEINEIENNCSDFNYGVELIRDYDFEDYCREIVNDELGYNLPWWIEVDWEATSDNIQQDYTEVEYQGATYYFR
jgi:hypothetical protein